MSSAAPKASRWTGAVRVIQFALIGALGFSAAPLAPKIYHEFGPGRCDECGGIMALLGILVLTAMNMCGTPWGLIGALVGAGVGWRAVRARRAQEPQKSEA